MLYARAKTERWAPSHKQDWSIVGGTILISANKNKIKIKICITLIRTINYNIPDTGILVIKRGNTLCFIVFEPGLKLSG